MQSNDVMQSNSIYNDLNFGRLIFKKKHGCRIRNDKIENCQIVQLSISIRIELKVDKRGCQKRKKKQFYAPKEKTQERTHKIYVSMYLFEELLCSFKDVHIVSTKVKFCHGCT